MNTERVNTFTAGKVTENKLAAFREFAREIKCDQIIEENLPYSLDIAIRPNLAGVYIQLRKRGDIYVGEAIDILERQKEHLNKGVQLVALGVIGISSADTQERKELETAIIAAAQKKGFWLANLSKMKLAEELNRQAEQLNVNAALGYRELFDRKAVMEFGTGGWLESLEKARSLARDLDWEKYSTFKASSYSYAALFAVSTFVRRTIARPEETYGRTWCIEISEDGYPAAEWINVRTLTGKVFEVGVLQTDEDSRLRARFWVEKDRLDLFVNACGQNNKVMQMNLGITIGVFDLKRNYVDLRNSTSMQTKFFYQRTPKQVRWEMDLEQAVELLQSRWGVALLSGCVETVSRKSTGEGFRLGRLLF